MKFRECPVEIRVRLSERPEGRQRDQREETERPEGETARPEGAEGGRQRDQREKTERPEGGDRETRGRRQRNQREENRETTGKEIERLEGDSQRDQRKGT